MSNETPLLKIILNVLDDYKAIDVVLLDVQAMTSITNYMVICSGTSGRHVRSLAEHVMTDCKQQGYKILGSEGIDAGEWALVDTGDVIVHLMGVDTRDFYQLEKLWTPIGDMSDAGSLEDTA